MLRCTCAKGFSGTHCRLSNTQCQLFQSAELCGHGTCIPANNQHGYTCLCDQGWSTNTTLATNSTASLVCDVDIDECEETKNPCHNGCINLPGSFKCGPCPAGYTGDGMNCYDIDECDSNNGGCSSSPLVRCINTEGSYVCGKCPPGWIGDGHTCDLAPSNSCDAEKICHPQAKCEYISNIATCTCAHGMFGHGFGPEGCHTNPMTDSCENHICQNNGTCLAMGRSTRCMCPLGYSGALCETKDACHPNPCENEGTCKALGDESYKCSCPRGTTGKRCEVLRSVCSSIQRKPSGELSYPADGATEYAPLERCAWIIRTLPNRILRLNFLTFDVEPDPECSRDWLQIHDGNSLAAQLIGRFCGNELPLNGTILSSHNVLFFWFRSDNATQRSGFHMNWTSQVYVCGVTLEVAIGETGVIRSPGYPGKVAAHRDCQWKFTAPMGYRFHLRIYDIEMGNSPNCTGDSLKPKEVQTEVIVIVLILDKIGASNDNQPQILSKNGGLALQSVRDKNIHLRLNQGSSLIFNDTDILEEIHQLYTYEDKSTTFSRKSVSDEVHKLREGISRLVQRFSHFENSTRNTLKMRVMRQFLRRLNRLTMRLSVIEENVSQNECTDGPCKNGGTCYDLYKGYHCECPDGWQIYDADLISKEYCQITTPQTLRTSSNELKLKLHTDGYGSDTSFQLHFEVESSIPHCGGVFTAASGIILGPSEPSICLYSIKQPLNMQVKITFAELNLSDEENCNLHSIEIFDGKTDEDSRLLIACGGTVVPPPVVSSGNSVLIRYMNKFPTKGLESPFKIKYTQDCEFRYFGPDNGIITTPNYPNPFTEHITCTYHIYGPAETMVLANFTDISLPPTGGLDNAANDAVAMQNDTLTYFEVHLSDTNRQCFYKAASPMELYSELNKMTIVFHATSNAARARGLRIEYSFEETECGGVYTEPSGIFMKGLHDGICKYIFEASEDKHIHLSFTHYTLMDTKLSTEIYGRMPGEKNVLLKNISSSNQSVNETFHFNVITVIPDLSVFLFGGTYEFVNNTEACGGNYVALYGVIKSPNWPRLYSAKLDCVWTISAPMGYKIELRVQNFTLEPECTGDILEIRNGKFPDSPLIGRYCGQEIPSRIPSFGNSLYLRFTTDSTVEAPGFHIIWEQMETGCGGKLTSHKGSIHSPMVATFEEIGVKCDWLIHVAEGSGIQLKLTYLTNPEDFCRRNNLHIYQGSTTSKPFDNQPCLRPMEKNEELFFSSDNQMLVVYTAFNVGEDYTDFVIDYETYCKTVLDHVQGIIESPNFPEPYPELLDCRWDIKAGLNNHIKLAFSHFSLETSDLECENDYVEVWDMKDEDILKKYHLCSRPNDVITSEGNQLRVRLVTDYSNNKNGFRAEYTRVGCGEVLTNEFGTIASPNYPFSGGLECEWYIEVPAGKQIVFTVTECQGDYEHVNCSLDSITVKESKTSPYTLMHYCISQQPITNIYSPMNRLYVQYQAGPSRGRKFFKAMYHTRDATCGGVLRVTSGWLYSPSYPRNTTEELSCKWDISVADANVIYLTIKELEFNQSENCEDNYLKIAEESSERTVTNVSKICSLDRGLFMLNSSRVTIEYKNQKSLYGSRFMLLYRSMCGGKLEMDSGLIVAASNEDCFWTLSVAKGNSISLNILELDCFCSKTENGTKSCGTRGLGLSTNNENPQTYTDLICEKFQSHMIFESTQLYIYTNGINFRATYSTTQHSCGGTITAARGILTSPNYPLPYAGNIECIWTITAKLGNTIQIEFDDLDMAASEHCNEDFLEIRSWLGSKALAIYCGNAVPEEILKSKDSMWLKFRSSEGSSGKGFKLKWSYAHLTEYVNETRGLIESPPTSLLRNEDETFAWRILVPRQQFVALYFKTYLDGLKLYDGYDSTALPIEISDAPWRFVSSSNVLYFETDIENPNYFQISWNTTNVTVVDSNVTTSKCHVDRLIKPHASVMIYSPNYPSKYDNNLACDWIFKPFLSTQHVVCEVYEVKLENVSACTSDYLKISTSSDLVQWHEEAKLCDSPDKTYTPYRIYNGTPNLKLDFVTDVSIKGKGFAARIITKCGSNLTQSVGFIEGEKLLYETDCHWRIRVRPGKRILLQFDFAPAIVKNPPECLDYVLIYDGIDRHAPLLPPGKLCIPQNVSQIQMNSSSNYLAIQYKLALPRPIMSRRWNLTYREYSTCNEEYRLIPEANSINITSPNYPNVPPPHTECEWRVMAPRGELIDIKFFDDFHMNTKYCDREYVELFDGATALAKSLGKYCRTPPPLKTTQNLLYIHYLTDVSEPRAGFKVQLSIGKCGGTFTASSEIITSPGYPQPGAYPAHSECDYVISQPADTRIRLILLNINLPFNHNFPKSKDYLEIIPIIPAEVNETIPSVFVFGNATRGTQIDLNVNKAIIRFHTSARATLYHGFQIKFNRFSGQCHQEMEGVSGPITLSFPRRSFYSSYCRWKMTVPKGLRVRLEFLNMGDFEVQNESR
uniref:Uncharacterized protein n=2 Tax=Musca domestica TaxID=7370 RepID=A0A1I8N3F6_MUSDO